MNCKYCGAALPTNGGVCPECGRMIPIDQMKQMKEMTDPGWNTYRNKDTAMYKKETAYDDAKTGKMVLLVLLGIAAAIIFIIILATK